MMRILPITTPAQAVATPVNENPGTVPPWLATTVHHAANGNHGIVPPWFTGTSFDRSAVEAPVGREVPRPTLYDPTNPIVTDPDVPVIM
jgi:hypothetical protein